MSLTDDLRRLDDRLRKQIPNDQYDVIANRTIQLATPVWGILVFTLARLAPELILDSGCKY